jgi:DNA (cytosine-5)-methyltransferase 1
MRVLDLFSGIGGFSLGLERAGMTTVAFCEIEPFPRRVLAKHWPGVPIHDDIKSLDGSQYRGAIDVVCGGFPCQPFSLAGKRKGKDDDRHLWPEMLRVIREVQPRFVIGENVGGFIGMELDNCLSDLEALGYACGAFVVPACAVDAKHRRDRVWILADRDRDRESSVSVYAEARELCAVDVADSDSDSGERLKPCLADSQERQEQGERQARPCGDGFRRWATEPAVGRVVNGISRGMDRSARLRALGNAVVPQIVEQIGRAIMEAA